ncbi:bifunctional metallophosphatase/5'-nucleotidase [Bordetella petrii]|uniref:bifunctional metallophosphatase/5'-nucleotidase n=1 Tax=Bordetella petrii TaxID=94624 RepID=UPI001E54C0FC|nr:5'-nucleotidase C-terminal domain-containing protein [Bordetella petrii]MCD0503819.1 5'-nucleotidase C-terminal domain-containing protein [Bordetella petrii]
MLFRRSALGGGLLCAALLSACGSGSDDDDHDALPPPQASNYQLQILHTNDHHSHLDGSAYDLQLGGMSTRVQLGGFSRVAGVIDRLRTPDTLVLNSGELNGTLYFSLFKGEPDFKLFNALGLDAYQLGNHEFDEGEAVLRGLIDMATFPILGANVKPTSRSPLYGAPIKPYVIREMNGQKVGVIGILKVEKTVNSSMVTDAVEFTEEVSTVRQNVDELKAQGINKIIVLSHLGYDGDLALGRQVNDIDVIIGGDTHDLLDSTGELAAMGLEVDGDYPTVVSAPDGRQVYIAQAWEMALGVGVLNVEFDPQGDVLAARGNIVLPVDKPFLQADAQGDFVAVDAAREAELAALIASSETLALQAPDAEVAAILQPYSQQLEDFRQQTLGSVAQTLPFDRIPAAFAAGSAPTGSYAAYYVADAFLKYMPRADIAIQNAGGVRTQFLQGPFSVADAYTMLPFSNTVATVDLRGADVIAVLEDAAQYALTSGSTGAFPYASHLRFDVFKSQPPGSRIQNVEVKDRAAGTWAPIDPAATYRVATNSFTALGKDGYETFARAIAADPGVHEDSHVAYAVPLVEYFQKHLPGNELPVLDPADYSLKSVTD